ncbi:hypothetical protein IMZ48_45470 [Candidatus Bathyarchaeota archaeon]|nr:hypothetical protein [Candidatus Bathyarchaeota archaeon]
MARLNRLRDWGCSGDSFESEFPGYANLKEQLPEFNDAISSYRCDG